MSKARSNVWKLRPVIDATDPVYGAVAGADSGAALNLAITAAFAQGGGTVQLLTPGSYSIETSVLLKSGVHLALGPGVILTAKTGLNAPVMQNATAISSKSVVGITNVGRIATANVLAHGYVAGDMVHLSGASPDNYNGWHRVISAPTSDTFTFYIDQNAGADSGVISVFKAVESNIKISGGKILGNALNTVGSNHGLYLEGVQDFEIDGLLVDGTYHNGVFVSSGVRGRMFRVRGDNVVNGSFNGILIGQTSSLRYVDDLEMVACDGNNCGQDGIIIERGHGIRLIACGGQFNGQTAIKLAKPSDCLALGCWGQYNINGLQIQASGGNRGITVAEGFFNENRDSGIFVNNLDTTLPLRDVIIRGNQCHRNGQNPTSTSYGIAIEPSAGATIDRISIEGNHCNEQVRGLSFGDSGSVTNATVRGNFGSGNTLDIYFGTSLALTSLIYDDNSFPDFTDGFSWTPVLTFDTPGDLNVAYSQQIARYWRTGEKELTLWVNILTSTFTHSTASGNLKITGLPFTTLNVPNFTQLGGGLGWRGITKANYTDINPFILAGGSAINFAASGSGQALAVIGTGDMPSGGTVQLTFQMKIRLP